MYLDLHCHSVASDDARATVTQYAKWISSLRRKGRKVDGIVLTEHRTFDRTDYRSVEDKYGLLILRATELDTDAGHFLVYGINDEIERRFDFRYVRIDAVDLVRTADATGAIAVPAHPGRERVSFIDLMSDRDFSGVVAVEKWNGGSRAWENERAERLIAERGYFGTAGSDAHFANAIGKLLTRFDATIRTIEDLVAELRRGAFSTARIEDTVEAGVA